MKYLISIFALIVLVSAVDEWKIKNQEDLVKIRKECVEMKKVPVENIEKYKKFEFTDDEITRSYIECILEKFGLFNGKEGGFKVEHLVKQLGQNRNHDEVKLEIESCVDKNEKGTDSAAWAYRGFKCFISKNLPLVQQSLKN